MNVTKRDIQDAFLICEDAFESCWSTLTRLKNQKIINKTLAYELLHFQEMLGVPLIELQQLRNKISAQKESLIARKSTYKPDWFKKKMRCLTDYQTGIDYVRNIGKGLGDAFAYFFYRNDLDLLEKQFSHERIDSALPETGLQGELFILKSFKHRDGKLTLYHGITNILRYGDFSFFDLQTHRITEIGELKTKRQETNQYDVVLSLILTEPVVHGAFKSPSHKKLGTLDQRTEERLNRQLAAIGKMLSLNNRGSNLDANVEGGLFCKEVENLFRKSKISKHTLSKIGDGLLLAGVRLRSRSLFARIFNRGRVELLTQVPDNIVEITKSLLKPDSVNNSIILGQLLYHEAYSDKNSPGTVPLFWYPLSDRLLKALYFSDFVVLIIYNPAHLIDDLMSRGYAVKSKYNKRMPGESKVVVENFDALLLLVLNQLQLEQTIIDIIENVHSLQSQDHLPRRLRVRARVAFDSSIDK